MRFFSLLAFGLLFLSGAAWAADGVLGQPVPYGIDLQAAASPVKAQMHDFHVKLLWIIVPITLFVMFLLFWVVVRYNKWVHATPSKTTHNTLLEVLWTLGPILIVAYIIYYSLTLLYYTDRVPATELTLKVKGYQWYWEYSYPEKGIEPFTSYMKKDNELKPGEPRLLEVDNRVVLPVGVPIRFEVTAGDVLHAFAVPAFGIKKDAIPGRLNDTWALIDKEGVYYGQCSELCGKDHAYMPIAIEAVPVETFNTWAERAKAGDITPPSKWTLAATSTNSTVAP